MKYAALLLLPALIFACAEPKAESEDPFLWLEDVEGEASMSWVLEQNETTKTALQAEAEYAELYETSLELLNATDRIAYPSILGDWAYNFWQDADHVRGIWRRTPVDDYAGGDPAWETLLDLDILSAEEDETWVFKGSDCLYPNYQRCLISLSRGGADAVEVREFDIEAKTFVEDGFFLPEAKGGASWVNEDLLYVQTDFGEGSMTTSGYPRFVKSWARGTALEEAEPVLEAATTDMGVFGGVYHSGGKAYHQFNKMITFYDKETYFVRDGEMILLDVPTDADVEVFNGMLLITLKSDWTVGGASYPQGAIISTDYDAFIAREEAVFETVIRPDERSSIEGYGTTRNSLVVVKLTNVIGELHEFSREGDQWVGRKMDAPDPGSISLVTTDDQSDRYFFTYTSFLQPTTLYYVADRASSPKEVRRLPDYFDASNFVTEQHEVASADGTIIPYFLVHAVDITLDGSNPTLLYGYGGFEISETPFYSGLTGKAWLEKGGVYALANIRGGGEFGPRWHQSALKANRQRAYDDFIAVAEDLVDLGITSPEHLGIQGGSNGGLLVGAVFVQRPDLFNAVLCGAPLLDMQRFNKMLAGASWMAEYGNPDLPDEWAFIKQYSPYHNVLADRSYPKVFFTTTTRDDRVHPAHARKMVAKMIDQGHDVLYFENTEGGHGSGSTNEQRALMYALRYAYLHGQLGG